MKMKITNIPKPIVNLQKGKTHMQWVITVAVNLTVMSYGLQIGWLASVANILQSEKSPTGSPLSTLDISWLASIPSLAATLSIPVWTFLVDKYGRKPCILMCAVLPAISWTFIIIAKNMSLLVSGRVASGICAGGCFYVIPMYVKEISQDNIRGSLGLVINTARNSGILVMYLMGYLDYYTILWIVLVVAVIGVIAVLKAPESPTYYVKIGKNDVAASTIAFLRNVKAVDRDVQIAIDSIKAEDEKFKSIPNVTFIGIFKQKAWRKGFIFMILLMVCHGLNGGFAIVNYAPIIMDMFEVTVNPELLSLGIPIFMIIGSLLSMVFIERLGRKPILASSFVVSLASFSALAAMLVVQKGESTGATPQWLPAAVLTLPVCAYAAAVSPMPTVIMAEMFNFRIRAKVMGCLVMVGYAGAFVQTLVFGPMSDAFGGYVTFSFYAAVNFCGSLVVLVLLPETKRKSVEEIEIELEKKLQR